MRLQILGSIAIVAGFVGGCGSAAKDMVPPHALSAQQDAAIRAQCMEVAKASRNAPGKEAYINEYYNAKVATSVVGGGLVGGALAASNEDNIRKKGEVFWMADHLKKCLRSKGYTAPGNG